MSIFGVTSIPTNTDGSAGRDKADVRPVPDLSTHLPAAEWNTVKRAVTELCAAIGRSTGVDAASIAAALLGMQSGPLTDSWRVAEDFIVTRDEEVVTTTGTGASVARSLAETAGEGAGHLLLQHTTSAGSVTWRPESAEVVPGNCNPRCRVRFRTPADLTASDMRMGLSDTAVGSYAWIGWDHSTTLRLFCESTNGGAADATDLITLSPSTWYEFEIRVTSGTEVSVFDATGALVKTLNTAGCALTDGDVANPFMARIARVAAATSMVIDYYVASGDRL